MRAGNPTPPKPPVDGYAALLPPARRAILDQLLFCSAIGSSVSVQPAIEAFVARTGDDELMITSQIFDRGARLRFSEIIPDCFG